MKRTRDAQLWKYGGTLAMHVAAMGAERPPVPASDRASPHVRSTLTAAGTRGSDRNLAAGGGVFPVGRASRPLASGDHGINPTHWSASRPTPGLGPVALAHAHAAQPDG